MLVLIYTVVAAVAGLLAYAALDLGGSVATLIFLAILFAGAAQRTLRAPESTGL